MTTKAPRPPRSWVLPTVVAVCVAVLVTVIVIVVASGQSFF